MTKHPSELHANLVELGAGRVFVLTDTTTIGRDAEAGVRLDDMMVAKRHAEIRRGSSGFVLHDLGSRHGTYVAGKRVVGQTVLNDGDEILIAGVRLRFDLKQPALREVPQAVTDADGSGPTVMKRLSAWTAQILVPAAELASFDELTRGHEKLRALLELTRALGVEHDPATLLERLLENTFGLVPAERGAIVVVDPSHDGTRWQVSRHRGGGRQPVTVPNTLIQEVMTHTTGVLTVDAAIDERFSRSESIASAGIQSALCVPLVYRGPTAAGTAPARGEILGILYVDCQEAIGAFGDDDLELLMSIGGQAALALKNALLVQQVRASETAERRRLEQVIGNMPAAVIVLDRDDRIAMVNPDGGRLLSALGAARTGDQLAKLGAESLTAVLARAGSNTADIAIGDRTHAVTVSTGDGMTVIALRDVTEERAQRARDAHEERLALLGRLAGGIAHDFNNLLAVIVNYTDFARERGATDVAEIMDDLQHVREAASRATALTRQLLAFGRREMIRPQVVDLNAHVSSVDRMLRRTLGAGIVVRTVFAASVPTIKIDPTQLEQVIANLLVNARDAMGQGGELTLTTATVEIDATDARRFGDIMPGRYAELVVRDTGTGMTRDVLARIFEPFFTTKDKLHGTGLGLATVHGIVKRAAGAITVESAVGKGSVFRVLLPATTEALAAAAAPLPELAAPKHLGTILVAEDQAPVLAVIQRILGRVGYQLITSTCGAEALSAAARHAGPIDLLLTDVIMPGMSGRELAEQLRLTRPDTKVLFVSGHVADEDREGVAGAGFLAKPFTSRELLEHVRAILGDAAVATAPKA
jgi:signal transduction histidine kinase/ActR/RegA family two-component response regulator